VTRAAHSLAGVCLACSWLVAACAGGGDGPVDAQAPSPSPRDTLGPAAPDADGVAPHAMSSEPLEAMIDPDPLRRIVTVAFSEPMDAALAEAVFWQDGEPEETVSGSWSDGDTLLTLGFDHSLSSGAPLHVDLRGLRDRAGNALDVAHPYLGDGVLDFELYAPSGESCGDPRIISQAASGNGFHTWYVPAGAGSSADGAFACEPGGSGADVVVEYEKSSGSLAEGGELLHVIAAGQAAAIVLEITSGACDGGGAKVEKCLAGRGTWDAFLDVPAGTYWIWVASALDTDSPAVTVSVEETPPTAVPAEGEGCFAPFTTASSNYTPPAMPGDPHTWSLPAWINSLDIADASGSPDSIHCGLDPDQGIQGVDAVIELEMAPLTNTLLVEARDFAALDVEVLGSCPGDAPNRVSHYCRGYVKGAPLSFTVSPAESPVYLWLGAPYTGGAFSGSEEIRVTELKLSPGEARSRPEPLLGSGPISPTSTVSLEVPDCFVSGANVHWYSYTSTETLVGVRANVVAPIALVDPTDHGVVCSADATTVAVGTRLPTGSGTVLIAVESPTPITQLEIIEGDYTGVGDARVDLDVTFPSDPDPTSMAIGSTLGFVGNGEAIWSFPRSGNDVAVEHALAEGLGGDQLGSDIHFADGRLYSVDTQSSTTTSRLFAVYDESTGLWGPDAWDDPAGYPASTPIHAITHDGAHLLMASRTSSAVGVRFLRVELTNPPAVPVLLGTNPGISNVRRLAADASYFYVIGRDSAFVSGVYRIDRADISAPATLLGEVDFTNASALVADDLTAAAHLYVRDASSLHVIARPSSSAPINLGITSIGVSGESMALDRPTHTLYLFADNGLNGTILTLH
jgi:hypothetical protein